MSSPGKASPPEVICLRNRQFSIPFSSSAIHRWIQAIAQLASQISDGCIDPGITI
ncbi:hypothetical protein [Nostoc sp. UHCC 0252]|uniref:hypothetical protein n=1 Tax=Nostoc sp. UHCC 0252 TaxID=3110241 RepID=UPI002B20CAB0|nr:hypothetical protein [Nostoc sp. UHCC 0252]MEA5602594.1 hypothetical protein [Nostoc sp. UHCC 0252]